MSRSMSAVLSLSCICLVSMVSMAEAHFVWVAVQSDKDGKPTAAVWFNEGAEAGAARLVDRLAPTQAWLHTKDGKSAPLKLTAQRDEETGSLKAPIAAAAAPYAVEATCRYGIFAHGDEPMLLHYYAKHLEAATAADLAAIGRAEKLPLDIVPRLSPEGLLLTVLWQGKPAADAVVTVVGPKDEEVELTTNAKGEATVKNAAAGNYAIRARVIVDGAGELDGKSYKTTHHYSTLTCKLPAASTAAVPASASATATTAKTSPAGASTSDLTAQQFLDRARDARALWVDFPGFTSEMTLWSGGKKADGKLTITADGEVKMRGFEGIERAAVEQLLESMVQHRMAGNGPQQPVVYVEEAAEHPLGRMIRFEGDTAMHSAYRVKDDVVSEVNRRMGDSKFTISVLEVARNPEGKYLPTTINVSYWDAKSGALKTSETHFSSWKRVGKFDLPARVAVIRSTAGGGQAIEMELKNQQLVGTEQAAVGK